MPRFHPWRLALVLGLAVVLVNLIGFGCAAFVRRDKASSLRQTESYQRAREEGRQAGVDGVPPESCPYPPGRYPWEQIRHQCWKEGWLEGFRSRPKP